MVHLRAGLVVLAIVASACGGTGEPLDISGAEQASGRPVSVSGLRALREGLPPGAPDPLVPLDEIVSGGPAPDGIPSIDDPRFVSVDAADFLRDEEPVLAIEIDGEARAYPVQILIWHEIVNDVIAGIPVAVTYCPLCNSAVAYDRRVDGRVLEFGTSGSLWNSALVMYDRDTETLWSHFTGTAIIGELTGVELETYPVATVAWGTWRNANADGRVLSRDTGHDRHYGRNPYPGYETFRGEPFMFEGEVDGRFTAMTRVVGIELGDDALAVPFVKLEEERVVEAVLGGESIVVMWSPGTASPLDRAMIADGVDVGSTGVFSATVNGEPSSFAVDARGVVRDERTGSAWDVLGRAFDGPLTGVRLERLTHVDTFWFAWVAFRPDTSLS